MRRQVLTTLGIVALCMASYAATFMQVKTDDGKTVSFDVDHVTEVVFDTTSSDHEYVDLGLPSGTLWATCNIGATKPEEFGDYFAWGETEPKEVYDWSTYKWCGGSAISMTKYCTNDNYGNVDNKKKLEAEDDAAIANWGSEWRMPTSEEQKELVEECYMVWTDNYNGSYISGIVFYKAKKSDEKNKFVGCWDTPSSDYSMNDVHAFFPSSDNILDSNVCYWSSSLYDYDSYALSVMQDEGAVWKSMDHRFKGHFIRAVRSKK